MTLQEIIQETTCLTDDQKQQLAYYILFSTLKKDNRNNLMQLFFHNTDFDIPSNFSEENKSIKKRIWKSKGKIKLGEELDNVNVRNYIYKDLYKQYE